jgi:hypothetical protein
VNNTKILRAIGGVNDTLVERAGLKNKVSQKKKMVWLKWALPAAACLVIAVAIAAPAILKQIPTIFVTPGGGGDVGSGGKVPSAIISGDKSTFDGLDSILGLPTSGYTWDEGEGVMSDRMATNELRLLMREFDSHDPDVKTVFAIVGVNSAEPFNEIRAAYGASKGQLAECDVLSDFFGDEINPPVNTLIQIRQFLYGGCTSDEETNLLRVGGVYVLPLINWQNEDFWTVYGDLDCLFEVDDTGMIQSHSQYKQLNKYDGQPLAALWKDIAYLYANPILRSRLAEDIIQYGYKITVDGDKIVLNSSDSDWHDWDDWDKERFIAEINDAGRISITTNGFNVFRPVEGMTLSEMENEVIKIEQFIPVRRNGE